MTVTTTRALILWTLNQWHRNDVKILLEASTKCPEEGALVRRKEGYRFVTNWANDSVIYCWGCTWTSAKTQQNIWIYIILWHFIYIGTKIFCVKNRIWLCLKIWFQHVFDISKTDILLYLYILNHDKWEFKVNINTWINQTMLNFPEHQCC